MRIFLIFLLLFTASAQAGSISVTMPEGTTISKAVARHVLDADHQDQIAGKINGSHVLFSDISPKAKYTLTLTLKDGTVLTGVDMGWYSIAPDKPDAGEMTDDDRRQICDVAKKVLSFYNINDVVLIQGNHNRAVALVQLVRDKAFHSDSGDEVIWRPETWYFENHHGGWEKPLQTDHNLRRERYTSHKAYHEVIDHLRWTPELGGLKVTPEQPDLKITLPTNAGTPIPPPGGGVQASSPANDTGSKNTPSTTPAKPAPPAENPPPLPTSPDEQ